MNRIVCDVCERTIRSGSTKAVHVAPIFHGERELGDPTAADLCGATCLRVWLDARWPVKPVDFEDARRRVREVIDAQRDELAMAGAFDDDFEAAS